VSAALCLLVFAVSAAGAAGDGGNGGNGGNGSSGSSGNSGSDGKVVVATPPAPREPARVSPAALHAGGVLNEDTVWRGEVLVEGQVTVAPQATLNVEPGTVVRFKGDAGRPALLMVQGRVVALGGKDAPVVFGSAFAAPAASDWQGVLLVGTEKKNQLENVRIEGALTGLGALYSTVALKNVRVERSATGLSFQDSLVTAEGGGVSGCEVGLSLSDSEATFAGISLEGNGQGGIVKMSSLYLADASLAGNKAALFAEHCRLKLKGGTVVGNGSGLRLKECEGALTGMSVIGNKEYGVSLVSSRLKVSGNRISGNGGSGLRVHDGAAVAWGNAIHDNGGYEVYNAGGEPFHAPGNWWGGLKPRVFENEGRGRVLVEPLLIERPAGF